MKDFLYIFQFKSSCIYKYYYIYSLIRKSIRKILGLGYQASFVKKGEYIIRNSIGTFSIIEPSDMHAILKPHNELSIKKYFDQTSEGIFIDIGANIGKYSVLVGKNKKTQIYSIEANPKIAKILSKNMELNKITNYKIITKGVGANIDTMTLNIPENHYGSGSIVNHIGEKGEKIKVNITTIDNIIQEYNIDTKKIKLIKMDIEGFEMEALKGFTKNLNKLIDGTTIIIEVFGINKQNKMKIFMKEHGFNPVHTYGDDNMIFKKTNNI